MPQPDAADSAARRCQSVHRKRARQCACIRAAAERQTRFLARP
ncbi:MAG: hypothetical protein ACK5PF_07585 [bacterium]